MTDGEDIITKPTAPPVPDGCLTVQFHDGKRKHFDFKDIRSWHWGDHDDVLIVRFHDGRAEIPRENIEAILIVDNSPEYRANLAIWRAFNGETCDPDV